MTEGMRETMERVERDDFYESRGAETCYCCPNDISRQNADCVCWRVKQSKLGPNKKSDRHHGAAGRYPVTDKFPCPVCGEVKEHWH